MSSRPPASPSRAATDSRIRAVLGPTNTGKTHLAIERMCGHSSGAIGFPLRLLAREVYDRVCAIKGEAQTALITGEERIEPPGARYLLCTAEAMPRNGGDRAFVALDEAQLAADRERGHIFTDRLLNARGREETMLLGAATLEPMVKALIPRVEVETRPRFSTLTHAGAAKLSRLPPRSAIVAFSVEQVYQVAELLRRFRGGAAVVMGALSPQTRNAQVALFQSGEVDYIVATDAIGMGLNLDVAHVAFASLSKFDGVRQRRLTPAEMAQIAGRAGRHQKDGSFGTLAGGGRGAALEFTEEEIYAIEQHRFAPLTKLFWREPEPRFGSLAMLVADLEAGPELPQLAAAPEAIDLAVLKLLAEDPAIVAEVTTPGRVRRFWEACQLPDFRQQGADQHARFVARLWRDLKDGHLGADFVAGRIADLDKVAGDIDTLQGRLAAVRSWAYICQRPDWVLARDEMAARARASEARLSDALHGKLTERFVNRRTAVLMKVMGKDAGLLKVALEADGRVLVEGHAIGHLEGFRFVVDESSDSEERRLMLAAAEKHLPELLAQRARTLVADELGDLRLEEGRIMRGTEIVAELERGKAITRPRLVLAPSLKAIEHTHRAVLAEALERWLEAQLAPLAPLRAIEEASADPAAGSEVRALLLTLIEGGGTIAREAAGLAIIPKEKRPLLRSMGVVIGALDVFVPALLKPAPRRLLHAIGADRRPVRAGMEAVIEGGSRLPAGYRRAGSQAIRVDMAEKLFRAAHESRVRASAQQQARGAQAAGGAGRRAAGGNSPTGQSAAAPAPTNEAGAVTAAPGRQGSEPGHVPHPAPAIAAETQDAPGAAAGQASGQKAADAGPVPDPSPAAVSATHGTDEGADSRPAGQGAAEGEPASGQSAAAQDSAQVSGEPAADREAASVQGPAQAAAPEAAAPSSPDPAPPTGATHDEPIAPTPAEQPQADAGAPAVGRSATGPARRGERGRGTGRADTSAPAARHFRIDQSLATSMGLSGEGFERLLSDAGFRHSGRRELAEGAFGPQAPLAWNWRAPRKDRPARGGGEPHEDRRNARRRGAPAGEGSAPGERSGNRRRKGGGKDSGKRGPGEGGGGGDKRRHEGGEPRRAEPRPGNAFASLADLFG